MICWKQKRGMMKKVKINIEDLLVVLQNMIDSEGTTEIIFFEHNNMPAIADANEPENVIVFSSVNENGEVNEDDETVH